MYVTFNIIEGIELDDQLADGLAHSVIVDNPTASRLWVAGAGKSVPPMTCGVILPIQPAIETAQVRWLTSASDEVRPEGNTPGRATVAFTDAALPPSEGQAFTAPKQAAKTVEETTRPSTEATMLPTTASEGETQVSLAPTHYPAPRWWRRTPWLLVAGACVFGLVMLAGELATVQPVNDESFHFEMVRWAVQQINGGHVVPLDGWFPYLNLGVAQFHHYQSLPHVITAYISLVFGTDSTERWLGYLLIALFPLSVYAGSRLLGWSQWVAGCAALISPLLVSTTGYGYEHFSYTWLGNGLWSQEWGMFLLPIAWGLSWRAINGTGRATYALAALAVGLTIAMHFLTGYFALLSIGVLVIVIWRGLWRRVGRGVVVFLGAALVALWVVVPLLTDAKFSNNSQFFQNTFWVDSYGAPQVLGWLFTGQIFDSGRFPIVSLLVALGTVACLVRIRRDARARALLGLMTLSLLLFFGRPTLGLILNLLPGGSELLLHRYLMGVHLAGDLLAGVGLAWAGGLVLRLLRRWQPRIHRLHLLPITAGLMGAAVLITLPAWLDRAAYDQNNAAFVAAQVDSDQTDGASLNVLIDRIKASGGGRAYAGLPGNWGHQYQVGEVPVYEYLADHDVDEVGYTLRTSSLVVDNEAYFNDNDPAQYQLYNVRYVLMPSGAQPPVPATLLATSGRHRLWQVETTGYFQLVDTAGIIAADQNDMAAQMQPFLQSAEFHQGHLATVAFDGAAAATPTLPAGSPPTPVGTSSDVFIQAQDGFFAGEVRANRTAAVLLKATYDPRWRVTVDGRDAAPYMVVPGFVAVTVGPGAHSVVFQYVSYPNYAVLLAIGVLTLLTLAFWPWLWRTWATGFFKRHRHVFRRGDR